MAVELELELELAMPVMAGNHFSKYEKSLTDHLDDTFLILDRP